MLIAIIKKKGKKGKKMEKPIRKASRCIVLKNNKVVLAKYPEGNAKAGYYEIPGGKIEEGETAKQAAIREVKEETGIAVKNLTYIGNMIVEYPNRIYDFEVFVTNEYEGELKNGKENIPEWISLNEMNEKKLLSNVIPLLPLIKPTWQKENKEFSLYIKTSEQEELQELTFTKQEKKEEEH